GKACESHSELVERGGAEGQGVGKDRTVKVDRVELPGGVQQLMSRFAIPDTLHAPAVPVPGQPRVELVRRAELVVHFPGKTRAVGPGQTFPVEILLRADRLQKPRRVRFRIRLEGEKV